MLLELKKITYHFMTLVRYANTFRNKIAFKPIATVSVRDEYINSESDKTSLMPKKIQKKQSLQSSKVSSSHQTPSYQTNTTSQLNKYTYKCINS